MIDIEIFDNCISEDTQTEIENLLFSNYFPWYLSCAPNHYTVDTKEIGTFNDSGLIVKEYIQLVHNFL
jgi:hypothetical protein